MGSLIDIGGGRWKCRFSRTKDGRRKQVTMSFEAQGKRAAKKGGGGNPQEARRRDAP